MLFVQMFVINSIQTLPILWIELKKTKFQEHILICVYFFQTSKFIIINKNGDQTNLRYYGFLKFKLCEQTKQIRKFWFWNFCKIFFTKTFILQSIFLKIQFFKWIFILFSSWKIGFAEEKNMEIIWYRWYNSLFSPI